MFSLVLQAYLRLIWFDLCSGRRDFSALYRKLRNYPVCQVRHQVQVEQITLAVETACVWYWKEARCLQRSLVTACMLRRYGVAAQLVIAVSQLPFRAHAWVEVDSRVVNDKPYVTEMYSVLDKC